jgi:hypothetical protein
MNVKIARIIRGALPSLALGASPSAVQNPFRRFLGGREHDSSSKPLTLLNFTFRQITSYSLSYSLLPIAPAFLVHAQPDAIGAQTK